MLNMTILVVYNYFIYVRDISNEPVRRAFEISLIFGVLYPGAYDML